MNAILFSRKVLQTIGFPIPNLFIWGDEVNYTLRAKDAGFLPVTIASAIHVHPKDRVQFASTLFGRRIIVAPSYWREYCMIRNMIFNLKNRRRYHGVGLIKDIFLYHLLRALSTSPFHCRYLANWGGALHNVEYSNVVLNA